MIENRPTRTSEEDAECKLLEAEFGGLCAKVCAQVEAGAQAGHTQVFLEVADVRQLLHVLSLRPFKVKTIAEAAFDLRRSKEV